MRFLAALFRVFGPCERARCGKRRGSLWLCNDGYEPCSIIRRRAAPQKIFWSRAAPRKIQHSFEDRIVSHLHGAVRDAVVEGRLEPFYSAAAQEGISTLTSVSADASHKLQELIGSLCGESEGHGRCQRVAVHTHSGHALQRGGLADSHERRAYLQAVCE